MNRQRFLPQALGLLTLARLALLPLTELSPVEAHAALCSSRLELWHPMTGPLLPLLMRLSSAIFGPHEFGIRFFAPLLMLGAGWLVWKMALGLFDVTTATWAVVIFQVTPLVNVASVTFTNTTLGIAESAGLMVLLRLALHRPRRFHLHWWAVAGMTLIAFFTDWRLAVFAVAGTGSLLLTRRGRSALLKWPVLPILGGTLALALLVFLGWNLKHDWAAFQLPGTGLSAFRSVWHSGLLGYGPLLILLLGWSVADVTLHRPLSYAPAVLLAFAWPLISLDLLSLAATPWPQAGFAAWLPPAVILAAARLMQTELVPMRAKVAVRTAVLLGAAVQSCLVLQPAIVRAFGGNWGFDPPRHAGFLPGNPSRDLDGWHRAAEEIRDAMAAHQLDPARCFLVADRWEVAAPLAFQSRDPALLQPAPSYPQVHVVSGDAGTAAFPSWPRFDAGPHAAAFREAIALFVTDDTSRHLAPESLRAAWPESRVIAVFEVTREGQPLRMLKVFACSPGSAAEKSKGVE
jgi:hypothetical protein